MKVALVSCSSLPEWEHDDRPLHEALRQRGVQVARPSWDDDLDWSTFDAAWIRTTWDYQEHLPRFLAWVDMVAASTTLINPAPIIRWNTHKSYLRDLERAGVPCVPTVWLDRGARVSVEDELQDRAWKRAFIKPAVGATARETLRFAVDAEGLQRAQAHCDRLLPNEDLLLQPYLSAVETQGERSAICVDGRVAHWVCKVPVPGDYRVQDDFGATDGPHEPSQAERELARSALDALDQPLLYARVDWLLDDEGQPRLNELELVEPSLFLRHGPGTAELLAEALVRRVGGER